MCGGLPPGSAPAVAGARVRSGRGLPQVFHVVEDLLVAPSGSVGRVVQRADLGLGLNLHLLVENLEKETHAVMVSRVTSCKTIPYLERSSTWLVVDIVGGSHLGGRLPIQLLALNLPLTPTLCVKLMISLK